MWEVIHNNATNALIFILTVLSIFDVIDMYGIDVKLFQYSKRKREKEQERIEKIIHKYMDNEKDLFRSDLQQHINYTLAEIGLKPRQSTKLFLTVEELKKANSIIKSKQDMNKMLEDLLRDKNILVYLDRTDPARQVIYPNLKYYINFTDAMSNEAISAQLLSILLFFIETVLKERGLSTGDINKIAIPTESNVILGIRLAKLLEIEPIIMHNKMRRVYEDQYWDGRVEQGDKVLIVHDVIYSADNIVNCIHHLSGFCSIVGVVSLVNRTDEYKNQQGKEQIEKTGFAVYSAIDVNDNVLATLSNSK